MLRTEFQELSASGLPTRTRSRPRWQLVTVPAFALCLLALFARIMIYPLQHDEQFYVSAGALLGRYPLYRGIGFSHLPNLALLFAAAFKLAGGTHLLLVGRLLLFAAWIGLLAALLLIARKYVRNPLIGGLMIALLALNPMVLNATGMAATNNFIPVPFALMGLYLFLRGADRDAPRPWMILASGLLLALAAGFKANYVPLLVPFAVAAVLCPPRLSLGNRLRTVALPLLVGGIVGGLPILFYFLSDPAGFLAHTVSFQRGPQLGYWAAHPQPHDPKIIGVGDKLLFAHRLWLSGVTMLTLVALVVLLAIGRVRPMVTWRWPVLLVAALAAIAAALSFLPTPAFAQYYTPPLPFAIVLVGLLYAELDAAGRKMARPLASALLVLATVTGAPILLPSLAGLASPDEWTGVRVSRDGALLAAMIHRSGTEGPVATLSPVHALEGGLPVYPHFVLGQFVYRATPWVPEGERRYFTYFATPQSAPALFDAQPPAAILTGLEGDTDTVFEGYARAHGYRAVPLILKKVEDAQNATLYLAR